MNTADQPAPYNRCDYRCDRCIYTKVCKVYQKEQERRKKHLLNGEDADDLLTVIKDLKADLERTFSMLKDKAEELGIDIDKISEKVSREFPEPEEFPLYKMTREFTLKTHQFLKNLRDESPYPEELVALKEDLEDLSWYHTLVSAKLARALSDLSDIDEFSREDAKNSAEIALMSIRACQIALSHILEAYPNLFDTLIELLVMSQKIEKAILEQFKNILEESN